MEKIYVKGAWCNVEDAKISVRERGFRFGDGVFETIRVRQGQPVMLERHLARLSAGIAAIQMRPPAEAIAALCHEILAQNSVIDGVLRVYVSRGIGSQGYLPTVAEPPTVVVETMALPPISTAPISLWLSATVRISPDMLPMQHKLAQGLNAILARMEAAENGADEALLLNAKGEIAEASSASIFWQDAAGVIHTPALASGALAGIGRQRILENLTVKEGCYPLAALQHAESVIIINAITGARQVQTLRPQGWQWPSDALFAKVSDWW